MLQCDFRYAHDKATDTPAGKRCTARATHRIEWEDGRRYSFGCDDHLEIEDAASVKPARVVRLFVLTDEQRSLIAGALVAGMDGGTEHSLCCAPDALEACAAIIGEEKAEELRTWCYEALGCCPSKYPDPEREQRYLDQISELEEF